MFVGFVIIDRSMSCLAGNITEIVAVVRDLPNPCYIGHVQTTEPNRLHKMEQKKRPIKEMCLLNPFTSLLTSVQDFEIIYDPTGKVQSKTQSQSQSVMFGLKGELKDRTDPGFILKTRH